MTRALLAALTLLALTTPAARAQSREDPNLVFTIYGGLSAGGGLWSRSQAMQAPGGPPFPLDTLVIARRLRPGLVAGLSATYFTSPHFGWTADVAYFGFGSEQRCAGPAVFAGTLNRQLCTNAHGEHVGTSLVGFLAGGTFRLLPGSALQPYVRATAGLGLLGSSYIETSAVVVDTACGSAGFCTATLLAESKARQFTWIAGLAVGTTFRLSPSSLVRFEARDVVTSLPTVTGPGDPLISSSTVSEGWAVKHVFTLLVGLDIVLERQHTRRY